MSPGDDEHECILVCVSKSIGIRPRKVIITFCLALMRPHPKNSFGAFRKRERDWNEYFTKPLGQGGWHTQGEVVGTGFVDHGDNPGITEGNHKSLIF